MYVEQIGIISLPLTKISQWYHDVCRHLGLPGRVLHILWRRKQTKYCRWQMSTSDTMTCVGTYFGLSGRVLHILWRHKQTTLNRFDCLSSIVCYYKNMSKSTSVPYTLSPRLIMPLSQQTLPHQKIECHSYLKIQNHQEQNNTLTESRQTIRDCNIRKTTSAWWVRRHLPHAASTERDWKTKSRTMWGSTQVRTHICACSSWERRFRIHSRGVRQLGGVLARSAFLHRSLVGGGGLELKHTSHSK